MKVSLALSLLIVLVTVVNAAKQDLEGIDIDGILNNPKLVTSHIRCMLEQTNPSSGKTQRCNSDGKAMKRMLPRVLNENCSGCSAEQIQNSDKIIDWMKKNKPADWADIERKYKN